jgi:hypothetical protein
VAVFQISPLCSGHWAHLSDFIQIFDSVGLVVIVHVSGFVAVQQDTDVISPVLGDNSGFPVGDYTATNTAVTP